MVAPLMTPALIAMLKKLLKKDKIGKGRKSSGPTAKKKLKKRIADKYKKMQKNPAGRKLY